MGLIRQCVDCGEPSGAYKRCDVCFIREQAEDRVRINAEIEKQREHYRKVYSGRANRDHIDRMLGRAGNSDDIPVDPLYKST